MGLYIKPYLSGTLSFSHGFQASVPVQKLENSHQLLKKNTTNTAGIRDSTFASQICRLSVMLVDSFQHSNSTSPVLFSHNPHALDATWHNTVKHILRTWNSSIDFPLLDSSMKRNAPIPVFGLSASSLFPCEWQRAGNAKCAALLQTAAWHELDFCGKHNKEIMMNRVRVTWNNNIWHLKTS